jgi:aspartyl-tRNA(Asn)/glutamyl-tRNA(Gln) amidotransferase subunit B
MAAQIVKGITGDWEIIIGLEVHAQINSNSKLFSGSSTEFGAEPNTQVSFVDAAMPGMLPTLNEHCVEQAVKTGLGLNAQINLMSIFDRKNYFYPDLPQGYQISQFHHPIVGKGVVHVDMPDGTVKEVGVTRLHLEQDAGKSMHDQSPTETFIDLNRSGVALMEIVSEPDMRSSEEAGEYMKKLRSILRYLDSCDGDMEKGSMRCDANVSVRKVGDTKLGTRAEVKNVNSIKNLMRAVDFEAQRQVNILESGGNINQETRLFDAGTGQTRSMRSKEEAHDYRYFPDPDLLPLNLTQSYVDNIKKSLPELPDDKKKRYISDMGLSPYDASVIVAEKTTAKFFEDVASKCDAKLAANWITVELFARLNKVGKGIEESPVSAAHIAELIGLIQDNTISGKIAKQVFEIMFETGKAPAAIVQEQGLTQVTDTGAIEKAIDEVLAANADKVAEFRSGKDKLFGFFVGQVMKATQGKANPATLNDILMKKLKG